MSGVLKVIGAIAGVVAMIPSPIQPIAAAVSAVATIGAGLLAKPPPVQGTVNNIVVALDGPAQLVLGRSYIGGQLSYDQGYGGKVSKVQNPYRFIVNTYGIGPCQNVEAITADFAVLSRSGAQINGFYQGWLYCSISYGEVPSGPVTPQWSGAPGWGATSKLSGKTTIGWSAKFDKEGEKWAAGFPQLGAIVHGPFAYDARFDDTVPGGSGSCRATNPLSWRAASYTNPACQYLSYILGRFYNGVKVFGIGAPLDSIDIEAFMAWANVCDANNWRVNGVLEEKGEDGERWNNLNRIAVAGGAKPAWNGGRWSIAYNAPRVALYTIGHDDLADESGKCEAVGASGNRPNIVIPKIRSEQHQWAMTPGTAIEIADLIAQDGEKRSEEITLELVTNAVQGAQLATYQAMNGRELGPITITCKPHMRHFSNGDKLILNLPEEGFAAMPVIITSRTIDPGSMKVTFILISENEGKHDYAMGRTTVLPPPVTLTTPEEIHEAYLTSQGPVQADNVYYGDGQTAEGLQPGQAGADVTGENEAADTKAVAGRPSDQVVAGIDQNGQRLDVETQRLDNAFEDIDALTTKADDLLAMYGDTASAATNAQAARDARDVATQARDQAVGAAGSAANEAAAAAGYAATTVQKAGEATDSASAAHGDAVIASGKRDEAVNAASTSVASAAVAQDGASAAQGAANTAVSAKGDAIAAAGTANNAAASATQQASAASDERRIAASWASVKGYLNRNVHFNEKTLLGWAERYHFVPVVDWYYGDAVNHSGSIAARSYIVADRMEINPEQEHTVEYGFWAGPQYIYGQAVSINCYNEADQWIGYASCPDLGDATGVRIGTWRIRGQNGGNNSFPAGTRFIRFHATANNNQITGDGITFWMLGIKQTESEYQARSSAIIAQNSSAAATAAASMASEERRIAASWASSGEYLNRGARIASADVLGQSWHRQNFDFSIHPSYGPAALRTDRTQSWLISKDYIYVDIDSAKEYTVDFMIYTGGTGDCWRWVYIECFGDNEADYLGNVLLPQSFGSGRGHQWLKGSWKLKGQANGAGGEVEAFQFRTGTRKVRLATRLNDGIETFDIDKWVWLLGIKETQRFSLAESLISTLSSTLATATSQIASVTNEVRAGTRSGNLVDGALLEVDATGFTSWTNQHGVNGVVIESDRSKPSADWMMEGTVNNLSVHQIGRSGLASPASDRGFYVPVTPGLWYDFSWFVAYHRTQVRLILFWQKDYSGNSVDGAPFPVSPWTAMGSVHGNQFERDWLHLSLGAPVQAPPGAVRAYCVARKGDTMSGETDSWAWWCKPQVMQVGQFDASPQPFQPGSNSSTVRRHDLAISDIEGSAAFTETVVQAGGGAPAIVRLKAGKGGSEALVAGSRILMMNPVNGEMVEAARFQNGVAMFNDAMIRKLQVAPRSDSQIYFPVQLRPKAYMGSDGQAIQYEGGKTLGATPDRIVPDLTGIAVNAGEALDVKAVNVSATQFEVYAKKTTPSAPAVQNTGAGAWVGGTPSIVVDKPTAADAYNGYYKFTVRVSIPRTSAEPLQGPPFNQYENYYDGSVTLYANAGGGWVAIASRTVMEKTMTNGVGPASIQVDVELTVQYNGTIGQHGGKEFGAHGDAYGTSIANILNVQYSTQNAGTITALSQSIPFLVYPPISD